MVNDDLKGILEVLVEEVKVLNGKNKMVDYYKSTRGTVDVDTAFLQLVTEGKIKVLYPLGTTEETIKPDNTYYISLPRR